MSILFPASGRRRTPFVWLVTSILVMAVTAGAQNQTPTVTPLRDVSALPYRIDIRPFDLGTGDRPTLHSFASARHDGKWLFVGGRTNGLHDVFGVGQNAFPPSSQNREVWVIDPATKQTWHRSLDSSSSGLSLRQIDSLTTTNAQSYQVDDKLYYAGGYGFDRTTQEFYTYDTLASIDVPGLMDWVRSAGGAASPHVRQVSDPLVKVTGGAMHRVGDTTHLVFGHDFSIPYSRGSEGVYTRQVRSFRVIDDDAGLRLDNRRQSAEDPAFRRRDLNVIRRLTLAPGSPEPLESLVALGGVFTEADGAWTVPVTIDADGTPTMADPAASSTFKQGLNNYTAANLGLFSASRNQTHAVLFGGISFGSVDRATGAYSEDTALPFVNNVTAVTIDADGTFAQYLMNADFPEVRTDDGELLRFGANAEFLAADGVPAWSNGQFDLDAMTSPTTLGYIYGGIMADAPHHGRTAAAGLVFEVVLTPVPEPAGTVFLLAMAALTTRRRRVVRVG